MAYGPVFLAGAALTLGAHVGWLRWMDVLDNVVTHPVTHAAPNASAWEPLRQILQQWEFTTEYAVVVGDATHGRLFTYEGGNFTLKTKIPTGSTSKWPSAMMFAGLVEDGSVKSLDDPISKYLPWWTQDPKDLRSTVTYRMLLSFTSGFGDGHPGEEANTRAARNWRANQAADQVPITSRRLASQPCNRTTGDLEGCAKWIYENVKLIGTPGQVYSYNSNHLQLAGAVAMAASGLNIKQIIQKYLVEAYDMTDSSYPVPNPDFGVDLVTTGADYEKFMAALLGHKVLRLKVQSFDYNEPQAEKYIWMHQLTMMKEDQLESMRCGLACEMLPEVSQVRVTRDALPLDTRGIVTRYAGDDCAIVFRGSKSLLNYLLADFDVKLANPFGGSCPDCKVHRGFYKSWQSLESQTLRALSELGCEKRPVRLSGHSLGGAMAMLAAFQLSFNFTIKELYTFGQPRVGDQGWVDAFEARMAKANVAYFRVTDYMDPVPHLPPAWLMGYRHAAPEVWYNATMLKRYKKCKGPDDDTCSSQFSLVSALFHMCNHCSYLGLNPCYVNADEPECMQGDLPSGLN